MLISGCMLEWVAWREVPWKVGDIRVSMHLGMGYPLSWLVACRHQVPPPRFIRIRLVLEGNPGPGLNDLGPEKLELFTWGKRRFGVIFH